MLVAAATIAYLGAFTAPWRAKLVQGALALCASQARGSRLPSPWILVLWPLLIPSTGLIAQPDPHPIPTTQMQPPHQGVPVSAGFSLASALGSPLEARRWLIAGLPNDAFSLDSAVIVARARRWPLMIDPQARGGPLLLGPRGQAPRSHMRKCKAHACERLNGI